MDFTCMWSLLVLSIQLKIQRWLSNLWAFSIHFFNTPILKLSLLSNFVFLTFHFEAVYLIIIYHMIWPMVFCCLFLPFAVFVFGPTEILFQVSCIKTSYFWGNGVGNKGSWVQLWNTELLACTTLPLYVPTQFANNEETRQLIML